MNDQPVRPVAGDYDRRWLVDDRFDLIVWYDARGAIYGFHLCYDKPYAERAFTWLIDRGFSHRRVDSGETSPLGNGTPILLPDGSFPDKRVGSEFWRHAEAVPTDLRELVLGEIGEYARRRA